MTFGAERGRVALPPPLLWDAYRRVVFRLQEPLDLDGTFSILTADNPRGKISDAYTNRRAERALFNKLCLWCRPSRLQGCSPAGGHCERSFAAPITRRQAQALARRCRQNALYHVEQGVLYLAPCLMEGRREERLGSFAERVVR